MRSTYTDEKCLRHDLKLFAKSIGQPYMKASKAYAEMLGYRNWKDLLHSGKSDNDIIPCFSDNIQYKYSGWYTPQSCELRNQLMLRGYKRHTVLYLCNRLLNSAISSDNDSKYWARGSYLIGIEDGEDVAKLQHAFSRYLMGLTILNAYIHKDDVQDHIDGGLWEALYKTETFKFFDGLGFIPTLLEARNTINSYKFEDYTIQKRTALAYIFQMMERNKRSSGVLETAEDYSISSVYTIKDDFSNLILPLKFSRPTLADKLRVCFYNMDVRPTLEKMIFPQCVPPDYPIKVTSRQYGDYFTFVD